MKATILIFIVFLVTNTALHAQSAIAIFKPTYGGDEHYGFATGSTEDDAKLKAMQALETKIPPNVVGQKFIYKSTRYKRSYAVGRGKDQYGHYWHYEASLGKYSEEDARKAVLELLSAEGYGAGEVVYSGNDQ
ncbi:MAG: hypothetical protein JST23_01010 [Bacteroidetes bacterium]|nr:hypothetical protein [Bacteroidota bacterium]